MATIRTFATMTLKDPKDLDEVVGIFQTFIRDVHEKDDGVLTYHYFIDDEGDRPVIYVHEEYADAKAHLDHFAHMDMEAAGRLMGLVELADPHYFGEPSAEERELLAGFGNVHFHRPLISIEEPVAQA